MNHKLYWWYHEITMFLIELTLRPFHYLFSNHHLLYTSHRWNRLFQDHLWSVRTQLVHFVMFPSERQFVLKIFYDISILEWCFLTL